MMKPNKEDLSVRINIQEQPKKFYATPCLTVHGTIADITNGSKTGNKDVGGKASLQSGFFN